MRIGVLQHDVLTFIFIQVVTVAVLNVVIKGVIFICSNCGLRLSHFNTHIQFSEEQQMFIDHFLIPHYEVVFKMVNVCFQFEKNLIWRYYTFNGYVILQRNLHFLLPLLYFSSIQILGFFPSLDGCCLKQVSQDVLQVFMKQE